MIKYNDAVKYSMQSEYRTDLAPVTTVHALDQSGTVVKASRNSKRLPWWYSRRLELTLSTIFAAAGFVWQLAVVSSIYFSYYTTVEVNIVKTDTLKPPAISICFPWVELLSNYKGLNRTSMKLRQLVQLQATVESKLTVNEILANIKHLDVVMKYHESGSFKTITSNAWLTPLITISSYLKSGDMCYRMHHSNQTDPNYSLKYKQLISGSKTGMIYEVKFNYLQIPRVRSFRIYLSKPTGYPRSRGFFPYVGHVLKLRPLVHRTVSYSKIETYFLPPPYLPSCKDYKKMGFESSHHFYDKCVESESLVRFGLIPFMTTKLPWNTNHILSRRQILRNQSIREQIQTINRYCDMISSAPDCHQIQYLPNIVFVRSSHSFTIELVVPNEPDIVTKFNAKMNFPEYLTYLFSCIGFWFGLSTLRLPFDLQRLYTLVLNSH